MTKLSLIVATADNGVIGNDNALPWHLPEDLRHFKRVTMGKPVLMGRKTYESIGRPLPGRANIVITRNTQFQAPGVHIVGSLNAALELGRQIASSESIDELVVIGGAQIYREALPQADRIYITEVHTSVEGDAHLPYIDWSQWSEIRRERYAASAPNAYDYSFVQYERINN